jgi:hypothetical protein
LNGCLAHLISESNNFIPSQYFELDIRGRHFWCYGLLTFARFLGSFAEYGWAWNQALRGDPYSAEFVESFIIFLYGITNTWMERFGANTGDPYTTKEIRHIGIAVRSIFMILWRVIHSVQVMFWLLDCSGWRSNPNVFATGWQHQYSAPPTTRIT